MREPRGDVVLTVVSTAGHVSNVDEDDDDCSDCPTTMSMMATGRRGAWPTDPQHGGKDC
jgi:hypothetical protein